ncbi:Oidioi.mRNA.OKI2018_I69.chr2.g6659.t1.cds [Oikopleura dioica]|uniref:Oidioi.mRNA.OKI2018_I69.chr2.g6659.t1.cds n=1 Tax=Oikopleura dioica TaxID=34765 RepID=A0ABN7TAL5_OIKDI|nr:Oidioi.mRNA.OKI2018_I69.chr2.g6659.t1.cds [Oikopleura dioica]
MGDKEKNVEDILKPGDIIKEKWIIVKMIGMGGFGQIYEAKYMKSGESAAVKVESSQYDKQVLKMEAEVLQKMKGKSKYICKFFGCGRESKFNYIIMSLLGNNISALRKATDSGYFSTSTALRLGVQMLRAIRSLHDVGYLHRDVKPSNFALGMGRHSRRLFIYDFGLARKFADDRGMLRPPRDTKCPFRGTLRYASLNAHNGQELGRHDDLWSFFYLMIEITYGQLPWRSLREAERIKHAKMRFDHKRFFELERVPKELKPFREYLESLDYYTKPNYDYLIGRLEFGMRERKIDKSEPLDWERL